MSKGNHTVNLRGVSNAVGLQKKPRRDRPQLFSLLIELSVGPHISLTNPHLFTPVLSEVQQIVLAYKLIMFHPKTKILIQKVLSERMLKGGAQFRMKGITPKNTVL